MNSTENTEIDEEFFDQADAHIFLSNDQTSKIGIGKVSSSMMYATARFNSWVTACGFDGGEEMGEARAETIDYFVDQYRLMLEENLDDYIQNFEKYMTRVDPDTPGKTRSELFDR